MPTLVIHAPNGTKSQIELGARPIRLGRAETCDVVLHDDAEVSRVHAEVTLDEQGRVVVADRMSKNGTRVDEGDVFRGAKRIAYRTIRIGGHDVTILGAGKPTPPTGAVLFSGDDPTTVGDTHYFPSSRKLDLNAQRLQLLIQLTERIGGVFERKQLLEQALDACCESLGFERGLIALKTQRGDTELPITRNVQRDEQGALKISRTLINRALIQGERAIVNNPATDLMNNLSESLVRFPICSALVVPIMNRSEILGVIYGDRITQASTYQSGDVDFLAAIAQQVGVGIANLRLLQEHVKALKVYAELDQAREIQQRLLPEEALALNRLTLEGYNDPSFAVSGDYFDYFPLDDRRVAFIIADVTGHGLSAALMMANVQAVVRVALTPDVALPDLATRVNRLICRNTAAHVFVTAILGVMDSESGLIEYVSAGHPGPVVVGRGGVQHVEERNSLPLGIEPEETFETVRVDAGRASALLFYTDGLTEAMDGNEQQLGLEPVVDALTRLTDVTSGGLIRTARSVLKDHLGGATRLDDLTLLAAHFRS